MLRLLLLPRTESFTAAMCFPQRGTPTSLEALLVRSQAPLRSLCRLTSVQPPRCVNSLLGLCLIVEVPPAQPHTSLCASNSQVNHLPNTMLLPVEALQPSAARIHSFHSSSELSAGGSGAVRQDSLITRCIAISGIIIPCSSPFR